MKNSLRMRLFALLSCAAIAAPVAAQGPSIPPMGGNGGSPFRLDCPPDSALVGLRGRVGALIDAIQPICQRFANGVPAAARIAQPGVGGGGGQPAEAACPNDSFATGISGNWGQQTYQIPGIKLQDGANLVHAVTLRCAAWSPKENAIVPVGEATLAGRQSGNSQRTPTDSAGWCPPGTAGTGLAGRSGIYLDSVTMVCAPLPAVSRVVLYSDADKQRGAAGKGGGELAQKITTIDCPAKVQAPPAIVGPADDWAVAGWPNLRLWKATTDAKSIVCLYVTANDQARQPDTWRYSRAMPAGQRCSPDPAVAGRVLCSPAVGNADRFQYQGGQGTPQPPRPPIR